MQKSQKGRSSNLEFDDNNEEEDLDDEATEFADMEVRMDEEKTTSVWPHNLWHIFGGSPDGRSAKARKNSKGSNDFQEESERTGQAKKNKGAFLSSLLLLQILRVR